LVEVKGPRDKLSGIQQAWLDQLLVAGMDVEVLRVKEMKEVISRPPPLLSSQEEDEEDEEDDEKEE